MKLAMEELGEGREPQTDNRINIQASQTYITKIILKIP